jgi:UDP-glucose 4-epimerase
VKSNFKNLNNKKILITGGTGSFGNSVARKLLCSEIAEIRIFSRDEKKQDDMRKRYNDPRLKFFIGDVRDKSSVFNAARGVNFIFHAAALKQVPSCEFFPIEALNTNALGTENVLEVAILCEIEKVICLSTDKAVYPINAMGISKAMMEKIAIARARNSGSTIISVTRYGNVMASRGSVIPLFMNQIRSGDKITITDPNMTRFMMSLDEAVDLVFYAFEHGDAGDIFVQKSPAVTIKTLSQALMKLMNSPDRKIDIIGTRHGEKLWEVLLSREEMVAAEDLGNYYRIPMDKRGLNYEKYINQGELKVSQAMEYNSHNAFQLDELSMQALLVNLEYFHAFMQGKFNEPED